MEEEEGQEQGTRLVVTVPDGVEAGQALLVEAPGGRELSVEGPEGLGPGDQLEVWGSDEEGEDGMAELEESASASEAPEPQAQGPEELAAAQA
eukprot:COSAG05_NODE_13014_length_445_cov_0.476879_1_plen_92_part_01